MINQIDVGDLIQRKESLLDSFLHSREVAELITSVLTPEDHLLSVTAETSPPKWHLGHVSWFYDKFLLEAFVPEHTMNPEFNFLFNSYYKGVGAHIPKEERKHIARPALSEVMNYRREINRKVSDLITRLDGDNFERASLIIEVGINHEEQHQELLFMDIKRNFYHNPMRPRYEGPALMSAGFVSAPVWQNIPSGLVQIGKAFRSEGFSYDHEGDSHMQWIDSFMLSSHLVRNGEYLEFIQHGGYENPLLWLSDGWDFKEKEGWKHPLYWEYQDGAWWIMTLSGMMPLDFSAPVGHVSYYEARAYAEWRGARLPTEFEWEAAASKEPVRGHFMENGGHEPHAPQEEHHYFSQIHGTLWEWTQSAYLPYPRYEKFGQQLGEYNSKFMCNQFVLRGGSCITPRSHYRPTYRNFYYPQNRWQFCGIRLAKDLV